MYMYMYMLVVWSPSQESDLTLTLTKRPCCRYHHKGSLELPASVDLTLSAYKTPVPAAVDSLSWYPREDSNPDRRC